MAGLLRRHMATATAAAAAGPAATQRVVPPTSFYSNNSSAKRKRRPSSVDVEQEQRGMISAVTAGAHRGPDGDISIEAAAAIVRMDQDIRSPALMYLREKEERREIMMIMDNATNDAKRPSSGPKTDPGSKSHSDAATDRQDMDVDADGPRDVDGDWLASGKPSIETAAASSGRDRSRSRSASRGRTVSGSNHGSLNSKSMAVSGDRFMPFRYDAEQVVYHLTPSKGAKRKATEDLDSNQSKMMAYRHLVVSEMLDVGFDSNNVPFPVSPTASPSSYRSRQPHANSSVDYVPPVETFLHYTPESKRAPEKAAHAYYHSTEHQRFQTTSLSGYSQQVISTPLKTLRSIARTPYKVLDAPELQDDFYLNLVDWSAKNLLGVGLGTCVYLWNAANCKVDKLCDFGPSDSVTSVSWQERGQAIAIGTNSGQLQIWDPVRSQRIASSKYHDARVGSVAWSSDLVTSGGRDRSIMVYDSRSHDPLVHKLQGHKQEVCGLRWSPCGNYLASGGNDNKLLIWDRKKLNEPLFTFKEHCAAVKAIAWSPHSHSFLASGGGTADRHIRFWNTATGSSMGSHDTQSQVCNIAWSKHANEIVSTHGYSQNQVVVWKLTPSYDKKTPSLLPLATLTGHTYRVLYLAAAPDGQSIVTGAGDETLRFWNVFDKPRLRKDKPLMEGLPPVSRIR